MDTQLLTICLLTGAINLIGALAYAARIAGIRTGRIAISFALFNLLVLVSRTANSFLGPFLAKRIETSLASGSGAGLERDFRIVLASASLAVLVGIVLVPTVQRLFVGAIGYFQRKRSTLRLLLHTATPAGFSAMREALAVPSVRHLRAIRRPQELGWGVLVANMLAQGLITVGVLSSLYAGYLNPEFRVTASQLSAVVNGFATILLFAFIDPQLSVLTDDTVEGRMSEPQFRSAIVWISGSRLIGTLLAQAVFIPAATAIAWVATRV